MMRAIAQAGYVPPTSCIWRRSAGQRPLSTVRGYESHIRVHINPVIGDLPWSG